MYKNTKTNLLKTSKAFFITCFILKVILALTLILGAAWFIFSLAEVWIHGWSSNWEYDYSRFNLFIFLLSL